MIFFGGFIELMHVDPSYPSMFFLPMLPKSSSRFGIILDEGGGGRKCNFVFVCCAEAQGTEG